MFWTHDRAAGQDCNVRTAWAETAAGTAWTSPIDAGFPGQIPRPLILPDGRIVCVYVHRHWPPSLRAVSSPDFGRTWERAGALAIYEHPFGTQPGMDGRRGFTAAILILASFFSAAGPAAPPYLFRRVFSGVGRGRWTRRVKEWRP